MSIHISTPHVAEVSITFTDNSGDAMCENTFYVEDNTDAIFDDVPTFVNDFWAAWLAHVAPVYSSAVLSNGVIFEDQRALPYAGAVFPKTPVAGGLAAGSTGMPNGNAFAIKRSTSALGRSGRGRLFVPVWAQNMLGGENVISLTVANNIVAGLTAFQAAVEGGTLPCLMGIVSKQNGGTPRAFGQFTQITAWGYTDATIDSQRRRLPGRGR